MKDMAPPMRLEMVADPVAFAALAPEWRDLHRAAAGGPFSSHEWIAATLSVFGENMPPLHIITAWQGRDLIAALTLGRSRKRLSKLGPNTSHLQMLCDERVGFHEVLSLPGMEDRAMALMGEALLADTRWGLIDLSPMLPTLALDDLRDNLRAAGLAEWVRPEIRRAVCDIAQGYPAYLDRRSRNFRKALRQSQARITTAGGQIFEAKGGDPRDDAILSRALAVSSRCWKAKAGSDLGTRPLDRAFVSALWSRLAPRGEMRVLLLNLGDRDAAAAFMLRQGTVEYGWVCDFDEDFAYLSPGRFVLAAVLETAAAEGLTTVDLMRQTPFTERFADRIETYERIRIARPLSLPRLWITMEERLRPIGVGLRRQHRRNTRKRGAYRAAMGAIKEETQDAAPR